MFSKRRTTAALLIVGFLVASLGMFAPQTEAQVANCLEATLSCCAAIWAAHQICGTFGSGSRACNYAQSIAYMTCNMAANVCGYPIDCSN